MEKPATLHLFDVCIGDITLHIVQDQRQKRRPDYLFIPSCFYGGIDLPDYWNCVKKAKTDLN